MATEDPEQAARPPAAFAEPQPAASGQILGMISLVAIASIIGAASEETQQRVIAALRCLNPSRAIEPAGGDEFQRLVNEEAIEDLIDKIERWADSFRASAGT